LKHQIAQLILDFEQPEQFIRSLHNLLNFYADRTHRAGQGGVPVPLLEVYQVPGPVLREISYELKPIARKKPEATLTLSQRLWQEPILEFRLLACSLLGQVNPAPPTQVTLVIQEWLDVKSEERIIQAILYQGMTRLRQENKTFYLELIKRWLSDSRTAYQRYGLWGLYYLAIDPDYHNLPDIFILLTPFLRSVPNELRPDILNILQNLAHYAPQETAYLLRQHLNKSDESDIAWLTRQLIPEFPPNLQEKLRQSQRTI
jgi:hypothetical protein